jgi:glycerol-3-phosphate cytidylyltransferase
MITGYTCGVYDLFHVGHVEILKNAKLMCDKLIVGLTTDEAVAYKGTESVIKYDDRKTILESCKYVDIVIPQENHDKVKAYHKIKYDILFVGDDWYNSEKWNEYETKLKSYGVKVVYFPYTKKISTTALKNTLKN